jgi:hypothetical protein
MWVVLFRGVKESKGLCKRFRGFGLDKGSRIMYKGVNWRLSLVLALRRFE